MLHIDEGIKIGDEVHVWDGTPMPPQAHTNKVKEWRSRNHSGIVAEYSEGNEIVVRVGYEGNGRRVFVNTIYSLSRGREKDLHITLHPPQSWKVKKTAKAKPAKD